MKYKGVTLKEGYEAELFVNVETTKRFRNPYDAEDYMEELEDGIIYAIDHLDFCLYLDEVDDRTIQIKSNELTFDQEGVDRITAICESLYASEDIRNVNITVGINTGEYIVNDITLDEFLMNVAF